MDLYYDQDESNPVFDVIGESQPLSRPLHSRQSKTALQTTHFSSRLCTLKFWGNAPPTESSNHSQALARAVRNKPQYHSLVLKFVIELSIEIPFIHTDDVKAIDGGIRSEGQSMEVRQGWWHDQEVALKTVRAGRIPDWTDRFNDDKKSTYRKIVKDLIYEIRAMSHKTLRAHRNIVTLLAVGFEPRYINNTARYPIETTSSPSIEAFSPILVLPWALSPLDSFWKTGELDHPHEAAEIVSDIADGLEALHKHDIVHSDLKPGNVLLFRDPSNPKKLVAKLTDFGAVSSKQNNRAPGGLTTRWAAPECFRDSLGAPTEYEFDLGPARDVFSFGLVAMYVALEGQLREKRPPGGFGEPEIGWDRFVKERCERLDRALTEHYGKKWPTHQRLLERWQSLLQETVIVDPYNRMEPDKLGKVRTMLLGSDPFEGAKKKFYDQVIPFSGRRGWRKTQRHWHLFCSKMATGRICKAIKILPPGIKNQLCKDYENFNAWAVNFSRDFRYKRAASRMSFIAYALADDPKCLPIKVDHKALLLMSCNAPGTKGLGFLESWVGLFLNLGLWYAPGTRKYIAEKISPAIGGSWERDEDADRRVVWDAAMKGDHITVMAMVDQNPKLLHTSYLGRMLIHHAASCDQVEVVKALLLRHRPLLHARTALEFTPLHVAVGGQAVSCIQYLLDEGARLDVKGVHGNTPLCHAQLLYVWSIVFPYFPSDKYHEAIKILRARNPPKEDLLSRQTMIKVGADLVRTRAHENFCKASLLCAASIAFWSCCGSLLHDGPIQALLRCLLYAAIVFGDRLVAPVEALLALPPAAIYSVIYTTTLAPQDLWSNLLFNIGLWQGHRHAFCASRLQEEKSWLWRATGHLDAFDPNNPNHDREVEQIISSRLFKH